MGKVRFGSSSSVEKQLVASTEATGSIVSMPQMTPVIQTKRDSRSRLHSMILSKRLKAVKKMISEIKTIEKQTVVEVRTIETPVTVENKFDDSSLVKEIQNLNVALAKAQDETCKLKSYIKQLESSVSQNMDVIQKEVDVLTEADMLPQHTVTENVIHHNNAAILYTSIGLLLINLLLMVVAK